MKDKKHGSCELEKQVIDFDGCECKGPGILEPERKRLDIYSKVQEK